MIKSILKKQFKQKLLKINIVKVIISPHLIEKNIKDSRNMLTGSSCGICGISSLDELNNNIETVFIITDQKYFYLRSSLIKDLVRLGANISDKVPALIEKALKQKVN